VGAVEARAALAAIVAVAAALRFRRLARRGGVLYRV
jgi:hypothetical protein